MFASRVNHCVCLCVCLYARCNFSMLPPDYIHEPTTTKTMHELCSNIVFFVGYDYLQRVFEYQPLFHIMFIYLCSMMLMLHVTHTTSGVICFLSAALHCMPLNMKFSQTRDSYSEKVDHFSRISLASIRIHLRNRFFFRHSCLNYITQQK